VGLGERGGGGEKEKKEKRREHPRDHIALHTYVKSRVTEEKVKGKGRKKCEVMGKGRKKGGKEKSFGQFLRQNILFDMRKHGGEGSQRRGGIKGEGKKGKKNERVLTASV